jgi:hypothetical protein
MEEDRTKWCLLEGIRKSLEIFLRSNSSPTWTISTRRISSTISISHKENREENSEGSLIRIAYKYVRRRY